MIVTRINPHRLGFARALETALAIKIQSTAISDEHVLVESLVTRHEPSHQLCADATSLILWQHQQVRIIDYQVTVRDGVAESNQLRVVPSCEERMGREQRLVQQLRLLCRGPLVGAVER